jgi:hypothetical protein
MCVDPGTLTTAQLAIASFATSAAGTVASFIGQHQEAKSAEAFQEEQDRLIANQLAKDRAATARQYEEIRQVSMDDSQQRLKDYLIESARLKVIGAESGLAGATQDRIEQESQNNAETDLATIEANRRRQTESAHSQGLARASNARYVKQPARKPSAFGAGLQIAGAGFKAYDEYDKATNPQRKTP